MTDEAVTRPPIAALLALLRVPSDEPELLQAQLKALSKLMPLLFFIMIVNTLAVGYTHYGVAPDIMTIGFPLLVMIGYGVRGWTFLKAGHRPMSDADAAHPVFRPIVELDAPLNLTGHFQLEAGRDTAVLNLGRPRKSPDVTLQGAHNATPSPWRRCTNFCFRRDL